MSAGAVPSTDPGRTGADFVAEARDQLAAAVGLVRHAAGQLDDAQVWWRPREDMNSVGNLLLHLAGNLRQRFGSVLGGGPDVRDRAAEFAERGPIPRAEVLRRFDEAAGLADATLAALTPERLAATCRYEILAGPTEKPALGLIFQTLAHLHGHAQEVVCLARWQLGERYAFRQPAGAPPRIEGATRRDAMK